MPEMSAFEKSFCRSAPWRLFAGKVILPWALQGVRPKGKALEVGGGSGAMAQALLTAFPDLRLTVTDFDEDMLGKARSLLARFSERVDIRRADATGLPFGDSTFDLVFSFIMLHHVVEWEKAIGECLRVLKPGGSLVGYDLLSTAPMRALHQAEGARYRMMPLTELKTAAANLPVDEVVLRKGLGGFIVRFQLTRS